MIERMILEIQPYLPLHISDVSWEDTNLNIRGSNWAFNTLSSWRVLKDNKIIIGSLDEDSLEIINALKDLKIENIETQEIILNIDPVFILSNGLRLEIFSTDTYEPWIFNIDEVGFFAATPNQPEIFM
jgi:hypothetical protein